MTYGLPSAETQAALRAAGLISDTLNVLDEVTSTVPDDEDGQRACRIASDWSGGEGSDLWALASSGTVCAHMVAEWGEIDDLRQANPDNDDIEWLYRYLAELDLTPNLTVDVVVEGALDESFDIRADYASEVVDVVAADVVANVTTDDWEVVAYDSWGDTIAQQRGDRFQWHGPRA